MPSQRKSRSSSSSASTKSRSRSSSRSGPTSGSASRGRSGASSKSNPDARSSSSSSSSRGSRGGGAAKTTTDHEEIRRFVESKRGRPACVKGTGGRGDVGLLRIDFPGGAGQDKLQPIEWEEFFEKFDDQNLAMIYQDRKRDGQSSTFVKLVDRKNAKAGSGSRGGARAGGRSRGR